jgi:hypothetical protein
LSQSAEKHSHYEQIYVSFGDCVRTWQNVYCLFQNSEATSKKKIEKLSFLRGTRDGKLTYGFFQKN